MKPIFANRRAELLRILSKLRFVSTSQDLSFERALTLMLAQRGRHSEWITLQSGTAAYLSLSDLAWVPEKWWKLITGEQQREAPTRLHRRQFEVCVCVQMVRELKSADLCVIGANNYSDTRDELVPLDECAQTREAYGQEVGLPVEADSFIQHVRGLLTAAAQKADDAYLDNPFFQIIDGRPKLGRVKKKPIPEGFQELDAALTKKLDKLELSLLDVLADTSQWIGWDKHLGPLSGHQGKIKEDVRRKILTTFAYGTGLGPTQTARNIADISARQIALSINAKPPPKNWRRRFSTSSMATISSSYRIIGAIPSGLLPTALSGTCTKTTCCRSATFATEAMAVWPIITSATLTLRCSRISSRVVPGRPSTFSMA